MRVKICGITNRADGIAAIECGADALGFNLWLGSRRHVALHALEDMTMGLPNGIERVAVVVDPTFAEAIEIFETGCIDSLQLHGSESTELCRDLRDRGIAFSKAIAIDPQSSDDLIPDYATNTVLLDTKSQGGFGGTGETFPWDAARRFILTHSELRVWLAGGLTPENVGEAIQIVRPFGVDVTTGVESRVREKESARMKAFIDAVRSA